MTADMNYYYSKSYYKKYRYTPAYTLSIARTCLTQKSELRSFEESGDSFYAEHDLRQKSTPSLTRSVKKCVFSEKV